MENKWKWKIEQIPGQVIKHEGYCENNPCWNPWKNLPRPRKEIVWTGNQKKNQDYPDHSIAEVG